MRVSTYSWRGGLSWVFRNPRFTGASVAVAACYFALFGAIFLVTQHLQVLLGSDQR